MKIKQKNCKILQYLKQQIQKKSILVKKECESKSEMYS